MLKSELLQLIANGENSGVEFKRDDLRPAQLAKEIGTSSRANHVLKGQAMSACKVLLFPSVGPHCRVQWGQLESCRFTTGDTQRTMDLASQQVSQPDSVADLLAATAHGDRQAFAELYRLTQRRLYAIALVLLRQPDAAEDVVQETYLAIWRTASQYQPGRAPAWVWLMAIVRHRAIELLRQQRALINRYWHDAFIQMDDFTNEGVAASGSWPFQANLLKGGG